MSSPTSTKLHIEQWLFPVASITQENDALPPKQQMKEFEKSASHLLDLLPSDERAKVLKYFFPRDAKMSLGSQLLKHLYIKESCGVSWENAKISVRGDGKPCYLSPNPGNQIEFNVSHQAGLVALIGAKSADVDLGIDIVCVNERNDDVMIQKDGLFAWIDMHADVFAPSEIHYLKHDATSLYDFDGRPLINPSNYLESRAYIEQCEYRLPNRRNRADAEAVDDIIDAKLRRFYALWCLREAYVKMTGEALLAPWLQKLEFRAFGVPQASLSALTWKDQNDLSRGGYSEEFAIWFDGKQVRDTKMRIDALGTRYMVASAVRYKDRRELDGLESLERRWDLGEFCTINVSQIERRAKE